MNVHSSNSIAEIIGISRRSAETKDGIRIIELSSLGDLIPKDEAESIRRQLLARKVPVKQLTNHAQFGPWTEVKDFIETCMRVRFIPAAELPIEAELLLFDDVVAVYRAQPEVSVLIIEDKAFAAQQKSLFDMAWAKAKALELAADGSSATA
jgi:hypothetical protein